LQWYYLWFWPAGEGNEYVCECKQIQASRKIQCVYEYGLGWVCQGRGGETAQAGETETVGHTEKQECGGWAKASAMD
jgi:hypothetical protein